MSLDATEQNPQLSGFQALEVDPSHDAALMRQIHQLRFQVYCLEQGFLDAIDYPKGYEADEHDLRSFHFASCGRDGGLAGYVRLVCADAAGSFPFQAHCDALYPGIALPPTHQSVEISRLMVSATHRRQPDRSPEILCSMFRQMYMRSVRQGVRYWYAAMERSLVRVLQRMLGVEFRQIGPVTDYYGPVAPYLIDLHVLPAQLSVGHPSLLEAVLTPEMCS